MLFHARILPFRQTSQIIFYAAKGGGTEMKMKTGKLFWGLGFLLAAALIILDALGIIPSLLSAVGEVSVFALILGLLLLCYAIARLFKGRISAIFFPLAFIFLLFEKNISMLLGYEGADLINNWLVLLIALLLHVGFAILLPSSTFHRKHVKCSVKSDNKFNSSTVYVDCASFTPNVVENKLGECTVHFQNIERYEGEQTLNISNSLGAMTINVPSSWTLISDVDNSMGAVEIPAPHDGGGPVLYIKGTNSMGALEINFV